MRAPVPPRSSRPTFFGDPGPGKGLSRRHYHRKWIRALLFRNGPASRVELGRATGLPLSALTRICGDLVREGFVRERATARPFGRGRPRTLLEIDAASRGVVTLSYDSYGIEATVADLEGTLRWRRAWAGPFTKAPVLLEALRTAARTAVRSAIIPSGRLLAVGAADPGLVDRAHGRAMRAVNLPGWENVPVGPALEEATGLPVFVERGDGLQALGETTFGAGRGARNVLYVTIVRGGVGGGLIENGRWIEGRDGAAGEIGHMRASDDGPLCACGLRGCLEAHIAPHLLAERWLSASGKHGRRTSDPCRAFLEAAGEGDATARTILADAARVLARVLGSAVNLLNPQRIVLAGMLAENGEPFLSTLREELPRHALKELAKGLDIRTAELGDASTALGVVAAVRDTYFSFPAGAAALPEEGSEGRRTRE